MKVIKIFIFCLLFVQNIFGQSQIAIYPKNDFLTSDKTINFQFQPIDDIESYNIQISTDIEFSTIIIDSTFNDPQITLTLDYEKYYWHVRYNKDGINSEWSNFYKFEIIDLTVIGNLVQHYMSDTDVILNGANVSEWHDVSEYENVAIQSTPGSQPALIENVLNSYPAIRFDGTDDKLFINTGDTLGTMFIIANWNAGNTFTSYNGLINQQSSMIIFDGNPGSSQLLLSFSPYFGNNVYINDVQTVDFSPMDRYKIICGINTNPGFIENFVIGNDRDQSGRLWNGDVLEILMFKNAFNSSEKEIIYEYLRQKYAPLVNLGADIIIPYGFRDTAITTAEKPWFVDYMWSTGENTPIISVDETGIYSVTVTDIFGFTSQDEIYISYPGNDLIDTLICLCDTIVLYPGLGDDYNFLWSDSSNDTILKVWNAGDYWVSITDSFGYSKVTDVIHISVDSFPLIGVLPETGDYCEGGYISLDTIPQNSVFLWNTSSADSTCLITVAGEYSVEITNEYGCVIHDTVIVNIIDSVPFVYFCFDTVCYGVETQFTDLSEPYDDILSWDWDFGDEVQSVSQNPSHLFSSIDTFNVCLIVETNYCHNSLCRPVFIKENPVAEFSVDHGLSQCQATTVFFNNLSENITEETLYFWDFANGFTSDIESPNTSFSTPGEYDIKMVVFNENGCVDSILHTITVLSDVPDLPVVDIVSPVNGFVTDQNSESVKFTWNTVEGAISYWWEISIDTDFSNPIASLTTEDNFLFYTIDEIDTFYWRVGGIDLCGNVSDWSNVYHFTIIDLTTIGGLVQHYMSDTDVIMNDDNVSEWHDVSEYENAAIQSTLSSQPTLIENVLNSYPAIRFDGIDDRLLIDTGDTIGTLFIIANWNAGSTFPSYNGLINQQSSTIIFDGKPGSSELLIDFSPYFGNDIFINGIQNRELSPMERYKIISGINTNPDFIENFVIGSDRDQPSRFWNGDVIEIIMFKNAFNNTQQNLVHEYLRNKYSPPVNLLYDIRVPYGFCDTAITTAYKPWFTSYEWSTGETDSIIHVNRPGVYSVTVTDIFGFESSDDIRIFYPEVNDFADTIACFGSSVVWDAEITGDYTYQWYGSSETTQAITITDEGQYAVIISDTVGCQYKSDTISFSWDNYEFTASIGPYDTLLCVGNRLLLVSNADETVSYQWSTGSTDPQIVLTENDTYSVTVVNDNGCTATDFINVFLNGTVPYPDFSTSGQCDGQIVYFTDLSTATEGTINEWEWSIAGQQFSEEQNPVLQHGSLPGFELAGTYMVTLEIMTDDGCGDFVILPLTIYPLPEVAFMPNYFCQYADITFISTSTVENGNIFNNYWDFGTETGEGSFTFHTFNEAGLQTVELISVSDAFCSDTLVAVINVKPAELPQYTVENACQGNGAFFINTTPPNPIVLAKNWLWNFGDGTTDTISNPIHIYNTAGTFDTEVTVTFQNGCVVSAEQTVEIYSRPEVDIYSTDECAGRAFSPDSEVSTLSGEITGYKWTLEDSIQKESVLQNPEFVINNPGYYLLELEATTSYGCKYSDQEYIEVHANPVTDFDVTDTWGAVPFQIDFTNNSTNAVTYLWDFGTGDVSTDKNPYYIYADSGTYVVRLISYSAFGCTDTAEISIRSVIPLMDVVLYDLRNTITGNYMHSKVYIINNGTLPVNDLDIILNLGDGKVYREVIEYLAPWQVIDYSYTVEVYLADAEMPELVCAEAAPPAWEGYTDINTENNIVCNTDVEKFKVLRPFPNPAKDLLTFEIISSESQNLEILLINGIGETVYQKNITNHIGYSRQTITTSVFSNGMYYLRIVGSETSQNFKIEITR
ncbi:MAG TPA: PKD domain-containing protein [Bacteroidales bacterium]|nr:PKD domain-containing protein [Bacteroidales bacterium]